MCAHLLYQITNTNAFKSLRSVSFVFPVKLFPSKSMLTGRYSLFDSSPWCDGSTCLGQDLVACKWAPGVIWETSRYPRWADTDHVGRYRLRGTLPRQRLKGRRVTTWSPNVALRPPRAAGAPSEALGAPAGTPASLRCASRVRMGVSEMRRHLKRCQALRGAQPHLVASASRCYQNVSSCQKWGCCFLLHPLTHSNNTESSTGKANKLPVGKRKPAIFTGTKPQMETEISVSPLYGIKKEATWRPRFRHKHMEGVFMRIHKYVTSAPPEI